MKIKPKHLEQLEKEVQHIFDSGANEIRVYNMIQAFIEKRGEALFIPVVIDTIVCDCEIPKPKSPFIGDYDYDYCRCCNGHISQTNYL